MDNDVTVRTVITGEYVGVSESDTVQGVVELMRQDRTSSALVLRGSDPVGIVTEWDVLGMVADGEDPGSTPVFAVMSSPVVSVDGEAPLVDAASIMSNENVRNLLVENERTGETIGVLTDRDVIAAVASLHKTGQRPETGELVGESPESEPMGEPSTNAGTVLRDRRETPTDVAAGGPTGNGEPDAYVNQGVCERCSTLTDDLQEINGELVCADCREM